MNSIHVTAINDPYEGGIVLRSTALVTELTTDSGTITSVKISRKAKVAEGYGSWYDLKTVIVSNVTDLNFKLLDILTISGTTYDYKISVMAGDTALEHEYLWTIKCIFEGLFIGDFNEHYMAQSNFKTETKQNMSVEYVTTLSGKYPYRVSNSNLNYTTGTSSGLFLELSTDKRKLLPDEYHRYSNKVLNFLCNGDSKILKTHDGQAWCVSIDKEPTKVYSDYAGMNALQFTWTEIGEMPTSGLAGLAVV